MIAKKPGDSALGGARAPAGAVRPQESGGGPFVLEVSHNCWV